MNTRCKFAIAALWICAVTGVCQAQLVFEQRDLFIGGQGGYHTYRIPAMAQTPDGTLYAFAEARKNSPGDSGDIDLVMRQSSDGGLTWSPMRLLFDDGNNTMGQPTPIVDRTTGSFVLLFCRNNREMFASHYDSKTEQFDEPANITSVVKSLDVPFSVSRMGAGPTAGVQTDDGRLVAPVWVNETIGVANEYRAGVLYSDDDGTTWKPGGVPEIPADIVGINESTVAILPDGTLYMTQRTNAGTPKRSFSTSDDNGKTWSTAKLLPEIDPDMTAIKAGLTTIEPKGKANVSGLLFSAPEGPGRNNMALWFSPDTEQWSRISQINDQGAGYSELIQLDDGVAGLLYENGRDAYYDRISFARLPINQETVATSNGVEGDINQDGTLDLEDVSLFIERWDGSARYVGGLNSYSHGDLNYDGRNNLHDVALFRDYLQRAGLAHPASLAQLVVPEPATAVFTLMSLQMLRQRCLRYRAGGELLKQSSHVCLLPNW